MAEPTTPSQHKRYNLNNTLHRLWQHLQHACDDWLELPKKTWRTTPYLLKSIFLSSLLINILSLAFPLTLLQIYDRIIPNHAIHTLSLLVIGVTIALILEAVLRISRAYVSAWVDAKFEHITSTRAFNALLNSSLIDYQRDGPGVHLERLNAMGSLRDFYTGQAITALIDLPFVVIFLLLITYIAGWLVLIPLVMLILFISIALRLSRRLQPLLDDKRQLQDHRMSFIIEALSGIHTIKALSAESQMLRRYERLQNTAACNDHDISLNSSYPLTLGLLTSQFTMVLVVSFGSLQVIHNTLTVGGLAACTLLAGRCIQPLNRAIGILTRLQTIKIAKYKLQEVFAFKRESTVKAPRVDVLQGQISIEDVSLIYPGTTKAVFKHVNLHLPAKQTIAITGESSCGKSSLLWLIMGVLQPDSGRILIDDYDIAKYQVHGVRRQIAYLPQQGKLFNGTIMENITLFQNKYQQKAKQCAAELGLAEIIEHLPQGYDTKVAQQATEPLPRGVIQQIAIARALLHKPPIVLFDEADMAIDLHGDELLKKALINLRGHCSLILASHRPSIISLATQHYQLTTEGLIAQ